MDKIFICESCGKPELISEGFISETGLKICADCANETIAEKMEEIMEEDSFEDIQDKAFASEEENFEDNQNETIISEEEIDETNKKKKLSRKEKKEEKKRNKIELHEKYEQERLEKIEEKKRINREQSKEYLPEYGLNIDEQSTNELRNKNVDSTLSIVSILSSHDSKFNKLTRDMNMNVYQISDINLKEAIIQENLILIRQNEEIIRLLKEMIKKN